MSFCDYCELSVTKLTELVFVELISVNIYVICEMSIIGKLSQDTVVGNGSKLSE